MRGAPVGGAAQTYTHAREPRAVALRLTHGNVTRAENGNECGRNPLLGQGFPSSRARRRVCANHRNARGRRPTPQQLSPTPTGPVARPRGELLDSHVAGRSVQREDEVGGKQVAFVVGSTKTLANGVAVYPTYCARGQISAFPRRPCRTPLVRLGPAGSALGQTTGLPGTEPRRRSSRSALSLRVGGWSHGSASSAGGMTSKRSSSCT